MSLKLLLDENISQVVAEQVQRNRNEISIHSVHIWREGEFEGRADKALLLAARTEGPTLVTYDLKTIPNLLTELYAELEPHAGIIFVDGLTIANNNFGMLTRALIALWDKHHMDDWQNSILFLDRPNAT